MDAALVVEKAGQARDAVAESDADVWLTYARETRRCRSRASRTCWGSTSCAFAPQAFESVVTANVSRA
jgi:hypothetical protein